MIYYQQPEGGYTHNSGNAMYIGNSSVTEGRIYKWNGSTWTLAQANSGGNISTGALLAVANATGTASSVGMLLHGWVSNSTYWETAVESNAGGPIYLSDSSAGSPTKTKPTGTGTIVRIIGYAASEDGQAWFCPDNTYIQNT